jgi:hypothetical protein
MPIYQLENIPEEFVTPKHSTAHGLLITGTQVEVGLLRCKAAVAARRPRDRQSTQHLARGLARHHHGSWLADDDRRHHPHCRAAGCDCDRFDHL